MDRLLLLPDEDDRVAAWVGRLRGVKEEKADAAAMRAASMINRTMVAQVFWGCVAEAESATTGDHRNVKTSPDVVPTRGLR